MENEIILENNIEVQKDSREASNLFRLRKDSETVVLNEMVYLDEIKLIPKGMERELTIDCLEKVGYKRKINKKDGSEHFVLMNINLWVEYVASVFKACYKTSSNEIALYNAELGRYDLFSAEKGGTGYNDLAQIIRFIFNYSEILLWNGGNGTKTINALVLEIKEKVVRFNQGNYINCKNGVLLLDSQKVVKHSANFFTTHSSTIEYDPKAECPLFLETLEKIVDGDQDMITMIQQLFGYSISNSMAANVAFWLFGTGRNGKSLLMSILAEIIGPENVSHLPLKDFNEKFALEICLNKRLNICDENKQVKNFDTAVFKSITSNDKVHVTRKHISAVNVQLDTKLLMLFNKLPEISECTPALTERLIILPFNKTFYLDEADPFLKEKLIGELQGILNWSIEGYQQLRDNGFKFPKCDICEQAKIDYFKDNVPVLKFFLDRYEPALPSENKSINRTSLYTAYNNWAYMEYHIVYAKEEYFYKALQESLLAQGLRCDFRKSGLWVLANYKPIQN